MSNVFTAAVHREEDWYVAQYLEVDVASQGQTLDEALSNLGEAVGLYLEEAADPHPTATPLDDLRHAAVSTWLNNDVEGTRVAKWAGHSLAVLLRVYAKCQAGGEQAALDKLDRGYRVT